MLSPPRPRFARPTRLWITLILLASILILLACMQVTKLERAPASILRLEVLFQGGLTQGSQVTIAVVITTTSNAWAQFAGHQKLTCDGVTIRP
jgi:hypothetical protein